MIILGFDPGTAITGWGVIDSGKSRQKCIDVGVVTTSAGFQLARRLEIIYSEIKLLLKKYKPDVCVLEELFFNTNAKTALAVGQARGVILVCIQQLNLPIFEYTPLQVKMAMTGYGRADKNQIQQMVKTILKLGSIPKPDDAADALAVALTHAFTQREYLLRGRK